MVWKRLEKKDAHTVLDKLSSDEHAVVFSKDFTEVAYEELSFYSNFKLYRLINYATMPSFSMEYIGDDNVFIPLDGTANPIYAINAEAPIKLTNDNVVEYLDFFFSNVKGSDGDIYLIEDPKKMPALDSLDINQQKNITDNHIPLTILNDEASNDFIVSGTVYYGGCLISATIQVTSDGLINFKDREMLLRGIPFPNNEVNYYWMGER